MNRQTLILTIIAPIFLLGATVSIFAQAGGGERKSVKTQTGVGKPYGARDPETCQATGGSRVPTAAEAIESFKCNFEGEASHQLILVEDVSVQIGSAHPYNPSFGSFEPNIDTKYLIYPIRGSFQQYNCRTVTEYSQNAGKNCWIDNHPHAEGECYKTEWGDWHCFMLDKASKTIAENVPPPGAGTTDDADQTTARKNDPAPKNNPAPKNDKNTDDKAAQTDYPKPDFSEMEKWYEIVRYEYSDPAGTLTFWVKPKTGNAPIWFAIRFLDKDGVLVTPNDPRWGFQAAYNGSGNVGDVMKWNSYTPSELNMEKVASVKIVRMK